MTTLAEIEAATDGLSVEQKERRLRFLAERLRAEQAPPPAPRRFSRTQLDAWIAENEADARPARLRQFSTSPAGPPHLGVHLYPVYHVPNFHG